MPCHCILLLSYTVTAQIQQRHKEIHITLRCLFVLSCIELLKLCDYNEYFGAKENLFAEILTIAK